MSKAFKFKVTKLQLIILFLVVAGFGLRIKNLGIQSLWLDEAISSNAAMAFLENGSPVFPSGFLYSRGILNTFLIASSFKLFGVSEFAARLPSVLFGILTILLIYFAGSRWGNRRIGILAALITVFSVWEIAWSRQARMYQQLQFFYILSLFLFYELMTNKSLKKFVLLALSVLATVMSHEFGYVLIIVFVTYLAISTLKERNSLKNIRQRTIISAVFFCGALLIFAYFMGVISAILRTEINYYDAYIYLLKEELGIFLFLAVPGGTVLINRDWKKGLLLIAALIIPMYFIFFHVLFLGTRYLYFVIPVLFILVGYFLDFVIEYLIQSFVKIRDLQVKHAYFNRNNEYLKLRNNLIRYKISKNAVAEVIVVFLLVFAMYLTPAFTFTPKEKYDLGVNAPQSNFRDAYIFVKDNMMPGDMIISAWTPPAQFYLGKSDYWLSFDIAGIGSEKFLLNNSDREIYTNATAIPDTGTLMKIINEHDRGWVVVDEVAWYKLRPSIRDFISNNTTLYVEMGKDAIRVYGWKK